MSEKTKVQVVSTIPQGELGLVLIDEMNRNYNVWFARPSISKMVIEEDLMRGIDENIGMSRMLQKGYFKINTENIEEILDDKGITVEKKVLDDMELKLFLAKNDKDFKAELDNIHQTSIERMAYIMVDSGKVDFNKAKEVEKYINFKINDLVEQKNLEKETEVSK